MKYTATEIKHWDMAQGPDWRPCRPMNHICDSIVTRIRHAFGVLIGRYDALDWQEKEAFVEQPSAPLQSADDASRSVVEHLARVIYEQWAHQDGYVPWVDGGNSLKQSEARRIARDALEHCCPTAAL